MPSGDPPPCQAIPSPSAEPGTAGSALRVPPYRLIPRRADADRRSAAMPSIPLSCGRSVILRRNPAKPVPPTLLKQKSLPGFPRGGFWQAILDLTVFLVVRFANDHHCWADAIRRSAAMPGDPLSFGGTRQSRFRLTGWKTKKPPRVSPGRLSAGHPWPYGFPVCSVRD
jgi:hypothetical protein